MRKAQLRGDPLGEVMTQVFDAGEKASDAASRIEAAMRGKRMEVKVGSQWIVAAVLSGVLIGAALGFPGGWLFRDWQHLWACFGR
jgi:hypothetical protein